MGPADFLRNAMLVGIPAFMRNSSGVPIGLMSGGNSLPVIAQPVEVLSSSAVSATCVATGADEILASFTIPAGLLGVNSIIQIEPVWSFANSANNKLLKVKIGATVIYNVTRTTSAAEGPLIVLMNRNSLTSQIQPYANAYFTAGAVAPAVYTIDFSIAQTLSITGQRAAVEALSLEYYRVLHFVGA